MSRRRAGPSGRTGRIMKLTIEMKAGPEKARELEQTLHALLPAVRRAKGCRGCRVCRDVEDADLFFFEVSWDARASLEQFVNSHDGGALLGAVDLLSESAKAKVGNDVWDGMKALKKIRSEKNAGRKTGSLPGPPASEKLKAKKRRRNDDC